jgi:hypothetical protein
VRSLPLAILTAICAALWAAVTLSWLCGYKVGHGAARSDISVAGLTHIRKSVALYSAEGSLGLSVWNSAWVYKNPKNLADNVASAPAGIRYSTWPERPPKLLRDHARLSRWGPGLADWGFTFHTIPFKPPGSGYRHRLHLPGWFLSSLAGLPLGLCLMLIGRRLVRRQRRKRRRCERCAYDLRESKDRCPECGTPIPPQSEKSEFSPNPRPPAT